MGIMLYIYIKKILCSILVLQIYVYLTVT